MADFSTLILWILIITLVLLALTTVLVSRKIKGGELPLMDRNQLILNVEYLMRSRRWDTKADYERGKVTVTRDSLVAADIYFKQLPNGNIEVRSGVNASGLGWALTIVFLVMTFIGALVMAIALHFWSRGFAKKEVVPMIFDYHHTHGLNRAMKAFQAPYPLNY
jgi:hypothetical protein